MPQFRRRDNGDLVEARLVHATDGETTSSPFYRIHPTLVDPSGSGIRERDGDQAVHVAQGQWVVRDGEHVYPYPDEYFASMFVPVDDHEFVAHAHLPASHDQVAAREAEDAVRDNERYSELHGDGQNPDRVQAHAAYVAYMAGDRARAERILSQNLPEGHPTTVEDLFARRHEFVDPATITFLDQQSELNRLRQQVRTLTAGR